MIQIENWSSFQSYKDRNPPWIRLHKRLLDNYKYHQMTANSRATLVLLWLLASEDMDPVSGLIRHDYETITFRLRMMRKDFDAAIEECQKQGFLRVLQDRNETITDKLRFCHSETETETETEDIRRKRDQTDEVMFEDFWRLYPKQRAGSKEKAFISLKKALKRAPYEEIRDGLLNYVASDEVAKGFSKGAAAWLNDDRWTTVYTTIHKTQSVNNTDTINQQRERQRAMLNA